MEGLILDDADVEEDTIWNNQISGRNCVLFLVDTRKNMFNVHQGSSYFKQSMLCCRNAMLDIARKQRGDMIGVMLFGTKISEGKYAPDNVSIFQELVVPSVSIIKKFNAVIEDNFEQLREKFGNVDNTDLTRAVNYCQVVIHLCKKKLYLKNIVMMTYDDNPCGDDERAAFRARKQATDLYLHQIEFDVVSFGEEFDSSLLFKELVLTSRGELLKEWKGKDPIMRIKDVQNQIERLTQKFSRRLSLLRIGSNNSRLILQISLYKIFTEPRKFLTSVKNTDDSNENNNELNNGDFKDDNVTIDDDDDDDIFLQDDVMAKIAEDEKLATSKMETSASTSSALEIENQSSKVLPDAKNSSAEKVAEEEEEDKELHPLIGERFINITKAELKKRINAASFNIKRGFQLIGFVPTIEVPLYYNIGEPYFIVPYGRDKNNRLGFSHLLHKCQERGVSMAGWFCLTKSASPALTFLHPQRASKDGKHPDGFLLVKVPFSDDLFEVDEEESKLNNNPSEEQLKAAKMIVSKLTLPYTVDMFSDFEYLSRIAMIEALAMDYSSVPEIEDTTDIDLKDVEERLGELNTLFTSGDHSSESCSSPGKALKRPAANRKNEVTKHRKQFDVIEMIQNGQANKLTTAELRDVLKAEGIKSLSSMTKSRLIDVATRRFCSNSQSFM